MKKIILVLLLLILSTACSIGNKAKSQEEIYAEMEKEISKEFKDPTLDKKILCYRNSKVIDYNGYIQEELRNTFMED